MVCVGMCCHETLFVVYKCRRHQSLLQHTSVRRLVYTFVTHHQPCMQKKNVLFIIPNLWTINAIVVLVFLFVCFLGIDVVQIHSFLKACIFLRRSIHHIIGQCANSVGLKCFYLVWVFLFGMCLELHSNRLSKGHCFWRFSRGNMSNQPEAIAIELYKLQRYIPRI
jgi:hypothetical protein